MPRVRVVISSRRGFSLLGRWSGVQATLPRRPLRETGGPSVAVSEDADTELIDGLYSEADNRSVSAVLDLKLLLAQRVSNHVAEWAVMHWLLTCKPVEDCAQAELWSGGRDPAR